MPEEEDAGTPAYSFHTDDSFEPIAAVVKDYFQRPSNVPALNLNDLPNYESSSDEEQEPEVLH